MRHLLYDDEQVKLSEREVEIAALIVCQGWSNPQIAEHLGLSEAYVKKVLGGIYSALRLPNGRSDLIAWLVQYPEALDRQWAPIPRHVAGCPCDSPLCRINRHAQPAGLQFATTAPVRMPVRSALPQQPRRYRTPA